ncbi:MAG: NAD-dependent epimerase/dehydratase family protein, partial [Armatimonadota bacterium]
MRVLVTGGAGFIGSHTVDALLRRGHDVRILDALEPPVHPERVRPSYVPDEAEFVLGDVRRPQDWERALRGVDAVVHLAAYQDYLLDFSHFAHTNDVGTALLYEVAVAQKAPLRKVVIGSSQAVYGEGAYRCPADGVQYPSPRALARLQAGCWEIPCPICGGDMEPAWTDERVVSPHNQYAVSKHAQELYGLALGRLHGIPTVILRYSIVQGPRQSPRNAYSGVLRIFATRLLRAEPPILFEDGRQVRDYVAIDDVVEANLLALGADEMDDGAFNVGGDRSVTVEEFARMLCAVAGARVEPVVSGEFR